MFYNGFAGDVYSSGIAVSEDLRNWGKYESNPIFTVTRPESWESRIVDHQFCLPFEDRYYVWYSGANDISQHVGLAFLAASPVTSEKVEIHKGKNGSA